MPENSYHKSLRLQNFTVFKDVEFNFSPGVNAFVGENGTGKTHVLKALYAWQLATSREDYSLRDTIRDTFQTDEPNDLTQLGVDKSISAELHGEYGEKVWAFRLTPSRFPTQLGERRLGVARPVFIPATDMMGHTRHFVEAYDEVRLDFDITFRDIVVLMTLQRKNGPIYPATVNESAAAYITGGSQLEEAFDALRGKLGGSLEYDESEKRFYLATALGRITMPVVAEGIRKVATLLRLYQNGWLAPGTTLMWDEPEVNLNPALMDEVVAAVLGLARSGVQVFLATHSYIILKELELQRQEGDSLRMFAFGRNGNDGSVTVIPTESYDDLAPNTIERQYERIYDMQIDRMRGG
jgi:ABC-type hemin transport system ATPase subunit